MRAARDSNADLFATAELLVNQSVGGDIRELVQLKGGRNNRVFRVEMHDCPPLALKSYFSNPGDIRDRLKAEWDFIRYAWSRGVRAIPEPLAVDSAAHAALYSFVAGDKPSANRIGTDEVDAAADFVVAVNARPRDLAAFGVGSEACFSLEQHLAAVERRVQRLDQLDPNAPRRAEAERLFLARLRPIWRDVRSAISSAAARRKIDPAAVLDEGSHILSPSDIGFHNALSQDANAGAARSLTFLDFEYAGRDDPAKLVCDFFCQPETPVPLDYFERFLARLGEGLALDSQTQARCSLLLEDYDVKWV